MKAPGVFVPPPRGKARSEPDRIQAIQLRNIDWSWLDAEPIAVATSGVANLIAEQTAKLNADTARRRQAHLDFLQSDPSVQEIRLYILNAPYGMCGVWEEEERDEETGEIYPAGWVNPLDDNESHDQHINRTSAFHVSERVRIQDLFAEEFGQGSQPFCQHALMWYEPCARCEAEQMLILKGQDPDLLDFEDAKNVRRGNTRSANTVLAAADLSLWAGTDKKQVSAGDTTSGGKLNAIDAAGQRDRSNGGKKKIGRGLGHRSETGVAGHGSDSDAANGDDHAGGSQISLPPDPDYGGKKTGKSLGFKSGEVGGNVAAEALPPEQVNQNPEFQVDKRVLPPENRGPKTEIDSETYDPNADDDLKPPIKEDASE